ncbi:MAG: DnaD domain protein [Defluviitaleaceae bacterium]|nr:DnaD domain protein [Defluviitaleaceae bacterium]
MDKNFVCVSNKIIDEHLLAVSHGALLVCFYVCRHYGSGKRSFSKRSYVTIAKAIGLPKEQVAEAAEYWANAGIEAFSPVGNFSGRQRTYDTGEISILADESEEVRYLFKMAERVYNDALTYTDMSLLLDFYDRLKLPVHVIEVMLDYCCSRGVRNSNYLLRVAQDWADKGIVTVEDAEDYIKSFNSDFRAIMKAMGRSGRNITDAEMVYIQKWLKEYKLPSSLVIKACDRAIIQTGKGSISYIDKILTDWHKNGVKTVEDADAEKEHFDEGKLAASSAERSQSRQKSRFASSNKREWDFDKIMQMAVEQTDKLFKVE